MTKFIERIDEDADIEVAGYDTIVELYKIQNETLRDGLESFCALATLLIQTVKEDNTANRSNELRRIKLEESRHKLEKEQYLHGLRTQQSTRECLATEDTQGLPKKALASKSGSSTKRKAKAGGTKR